MYNTPRPTKVTPDKFRFGTSSHTQPILSFFGKYLYVKKVYDIDWLVPGIPMMNESCSLIDQKNAF